MCSLLELMLLATASLKLGMRGTSRFRHNRDLPRSDMLDLKGKLYCQICVDTCIRDFNRTVWSDNTYSLTLTTLNNL